MKKILVIAGARPNFVKIAPLMKAFQKHRDRFQVMLVHTGQHYDFAMSEVFFRNLEIPRPDIFLEVGSASHALQTAKIMTSFEEVCVKEQPDIVIVVGDVNSTLACSLVAAKIGIKVVHVESGLRSFDRTMPEEVNRLVTDSLSDYLFVSEESGLANLKKEGVSSKKIFYVGNIMIDTLLSSTEKIEQSDVLNALKIKPGEYAVLTLHRPSNVDSKMSLSKIYEILRFISEKLTIVYPIHPRTKKMLETFGLLSTYEGLSGLKMIEPLGYIDFIKLVKDSRFVLTDSGGIQEETTVMKIPCLTMRENTERPVTIRQGTNVLVGTDKARIVTHVKRILTGKSKKSKIPRFWDGKTAGRIVSIIRNAL
jgi:UDP-N-acetylglucosamine 2-epimerase (non-hydrolysing)